MGIAKMKFFRDYLLALSPYIVIVGLMILMLTAVGNHLKKESIKISKIERKFETGDIVKCKIDNRIGMVLENDIQLSKKKYVCIVVVRMPVDKKCDTGKENDLYKKCIFYDFELEKSELKTEKE